MQPYRQQSAQHYAQQTQNLDYSYINLDFNNIHDQRELERIIIQLKAIIQSKIKQINQLTAINDKEAEERDIILRRMTEKNLSNKDKIEHYSQLIFSLSQEYTKFNVISEEEKQRQKKLIDSAHNAEMNDMIKKMEDLQIEYKKLKQHEDLQAEYLNKIQMMKKDIITKQYKHTDGLNQLQAVQIKENQQLEEKMSQQITITHKTAPSHALNKITTELKTNEQQNIELKQKLLTLQTQLQKLKKQRNQILNKRKQLKINVTLNEDELEEYKAVGSLQKAKIKAYKDKIENMKILISDEVARKQKQVAERKKQRESNLKVQKLKLFNLQKQKQELKIKLQKMNLLAETILHQREEVENFFVMALNSCKQEIEDYEKGRVNMKADEPKAYGQKVDIDELLPKDKQRILTNLYAKLAYSSGK